MKSGFFIQPAARLNFPAVMLDSYAGTLYIARSDPAFMRAWRALLIRVVCLIAALKFVFIFKF
jgi:hypothetical protein